MPYCPVCKKQFETGTVCPDDKAELVEELPFQTVEGSNATWVEIASAATEDEARLLQGFLEAEGIVCQIESLRFSMEPVNFGSLGEIRLYVDAADEQAALDLLDRRETEYEQLPNEDAVVTDEGPADIEDDAQALSETEEK